ncbi:BLUF domain-containing protein [Roseivivax marinus]|uniref:BLUF domain-containing protein n=1 Tax=Roseivivax marinus TaxID=1379903 RepID=W4HN65_9RHOB|nr:BLUF domain-containing protein [Roseivivax marinus]ETW13415.1 BLUF domain-containing protein [Roseivivax marinus]
MGSRRYHRVVFESSTMLSDSSIENLDILREAMRANDRDGIASVMIKAGPRFVQMIEGPAQPVQAAYARIREDRRHFRVETLIDMPIVSPSLQECRCSACRCRRVPKRMGSRSCRTYCARTPS